MGKIKITERFGSFKGLRENKDNCINIKVSQLNDENMARVIIGGLSNIKMIRLLIDVKPNDEKKFMDYLNRLSTNYPNVEFHINLEFDGYFEYAKEIISKVNFKTKNITLWPDGNLRDRSYLNLTNLNCKTIIPIQYAMWHNNIERADSNNLFFLRKDVETKDGSLPFTEQFTYKNNNNIIEAFDSYLYNLRDALFLKNTVVEILRTDLKYLTDCNLSADQKILVLMKYFVDNFTYTDTPTPPSGSITFKDTYYPFRAANTLINKQGVCEGIAEAFMILLNNPVVQVDCRCLAGLADSSDLNSGHAWNVVRLVDEKDYRARWFYMDPTWNICEKNYFNWSFLKADKISQRKIYDCANPIYENYDNIELNENVMSYRLNDALDRIDKKKNGFSTINIGYSLQDIVDKVKRR